MIERAEIRSALITDIPYLYRICLLTGFNGTDASGYFSDPFLLGQYYAAPYVIFSSEFSFVLIDKNTRIPVGYILGTDDSLAFCAVRGEKWLAGLEQQCRCTENNKSEYEAEIKKMILNGVHYNPPDEYKKLSEVYPAHFHIDILPEMQHRGYGHELLEVLLSKMIDKGVKGIHLGVDRSNEKACRFYEREGFNIIQEKSWGYMMGKKFR
ncbi:MAG: GNAT family N-acetyltransferase [Treponema sp.]|nr:GNAT family N-acetyltransferase [Treponema sp.]